MKATELDGALRAVRSKTWMDEVEAALRTLDLLERRINEGHSDLCKWNLNVIREHLKKALQHSGDTSSSIEKLTDPTKLSRTNQ